MARPFNRWDPSANVDLFVKPSEGPLVIEADDLRWPLFAKPAIEPVVYANLDFIGYMQEFLYEGGSGPNSGFRARGYQYMPDGMSFFGTDLVNGEPRPDDPADLYSGEQYRYINGGYRMALRGIISAFLDDALNVDLVVDWGDGQPRAISDARGAWTGAVLSVLNGATVEADHLAYALHGKRIGDTSWEHRGGYVDRPISSFTPYTASGGPWDGVSSGRVRLLVTGGSPNWTITAQYDSGGGTWVDIASSVVDLRAYAVPPLEDMFLMLGYLFHGATKVYPGSFPSPVPSQDTYFPKVSVSQFTPFVPDMMDITLREAAKKSEWLTGFSQWYNAPVYAKLPVIDGICWPEGHPFGPEKIREFDADVQEWGVRFLGTTLVSFQGVEDRKYLVVSTATGKMNPVCQADVDSLGPQLPFTYVGKYRFKDMASWSTSRCLVSFGAAGFAATPTPTDNGLGLSWRPNNGGELVLEYWDGVSGSWLELSAPFRVSDYEDRPVSLAFAWTGERGIHVGRPDYQLRIVVDGVPVADVLEPNLDIRGTWRSSIGSGNPSVRESFLGMWYGGVTFYEITSDQDIIRAFDEDGDEGFSNPSFEIADDSGRPGEAEDWKWKSFHRQGGFAAFNMYRPDLEPYQSGLEGFEAGWMRSYTWVYADETARLAATGFTAEDVGKAAWQLDINKIFVLANHSPITWLDADAGENQDSIMDLSTTDIVAAIFNQGIPAFEGVLESFELWDGAPWLDAYNLLRPCDDGTGFAGWYDYVTGTNLDPICIESFEEAWDNDPLSTTGTNQWYPGTGVNGVLRGKPILFPLDIPPNENQLILVGDAITIPAMFPLPSLHYDDLATLVSDLNAVTAANLPPGIGLQWGSWSDGIDEGLTFGWDGSTNAPQWFSFATLESDQFRDARPLLGMRAFSPGQDYSGVGIAGWLFPSLPAGVDDTDRFLIDTWSFVEFMFVTDPYLGMLVLEYSQVAAVFDTAVPDPVRIERFTLQGWVSPTATWIPDLSAVTLDPVIFSGLTTVENFILAEWPDEPFPT